MQSNVAYCILGVPNIENNYLGSILKLAFLSARINEVSYVSDGCSGRASHIIAWRIKSPEYGEERDETAMYKMVGRNSACVFLVNALP